MAHREQPPALWSFRPAGRHLEPRNAWARVLSEASRVPSDRIRRGDLTEDEMRRFIEAAKALEAKFGEPRKAALTWKPKNTVAVDDEAGEKLLKLMDALNEHDDVQNVYANFEVSDEIADKLSA